MQTHICRYFAEVNQWENGGLPFDAQLLEKHGATTHIVVADGEDVLARCSLWISDLRLNQKRLGIIGHYAVLNNEAAKRVLDAACAYLYENNCEIAVGPMDGNTWRNYRLVTEAGEQAPFFMEPHNPVKYLQQFLDCGFNNAASYSSVLCNDLHSSRSHLSDVEKRLEGSGVTIRSLRMGDWEAELKRIYNVSAKAFVGNFLYEPVSKKEFLLMYQGLKNVISPELILLAECAGETVGFSFSYPDFSQQQRCETMNRIVLKTVAVLPGRRFAGLGNLLAEKTHHVALGMGFQSAIHALIHDGNVSRNVSTRYGETMRRYALFARDLTR